ncbi:MAG: type II secretion system secretin GspD [Cystobacterineae bacterium]|nr:type II secretion system secretin GspD [Cystobacterineae bacterium]
MRQLTAIPFLLLLLSAYPAGAQTETENAPSPENEPPPLPLPGNENPPPMPESIPTVLENALPENAPTPAMGNTPTPLPGESYRAMRRRMQRERNSKTPPNSSAQPPAQPIPSPTPQTPTPSRREPPPDPAPPSSPSPSASGPLNPSVLSCEEIKKQARFNIYFDKVDIDKLVQTVSDATCRTFILPENVRGKISIIGPENGKVEVSADEFYAAFLASLDANGFSVYRQGKFQKIIEKQRAKNYPIPTFTGSDTSSAFADQMITKMFRLKYVDSENTRTVLQQLVSPSGDVLSVPPNGLIINDLASNLARLEKILAQLDLRPSGEEIRAFQIQHATASSIAEKIEKLFDASPSSPASSPARRSGSSGRSSSPPPPPPASGESLAPSTLTQLIPDDRTNKLIIIASPAALESIQALIREIDIPVAGEGSIHVYYLENATAEEIAQTLQVFAQTSLSSAGGAAPQTRRANTSSRTGSRASSTTDTFQGEVRISADKSTNSLVITANQADYRALVKVIEKLDIRRRQVFVEAVIMEVSLDRSTEFGIQAHQGFSLENGTVPGVVATNYGKGLPPTIAGISSLASYGGFLAGLQGPDLNVPALSKLNINLPAFGIILNALQSDSNVNVLSTPHLLTLDNEEAEIVVGQNVPMQAGYSINPFLGNLAASGATNSLGALGGFGGYGPQINRQDVQLKLTVKPHINESDYIRLVINEQIEDIASVDPMLGPTTSKRVAKTTVVAKDQETVVIGGLMRDHNIENISKVPFFGDIPILGHLFRTQTKKKTKTNLLMFLTPYIIRDSSDFRRILERKLKERQSFVEQFYGAATGYDLLIDYARKPGPIARIAQLTSRELSKFENGGQGVDGERLISPKPNSQKANSKTENSKILTFSSDTLPTEPSPPSNPSVLDFSSPETFPPPENMGVVE